MKRILVSTLASCAMFASSASLASDEGRATETQPNLMGSHVSLGVGAAAHEGQTGYYIDLGWQFNDYAKVQFLTDSFLNKTTYNAKSILPDFDESTYGDGNFRPRHNNYTLSFTARYPYQLSASTIMAPYVEFGFNQMSTKDVEFSPLSASSSGSSDSSNSGSSIIPPVKLDFEDVGSIKFGVGFQFAFSDVHQWTIGAIGYSTDESWSDIELSDDQVGGTLRYEYRPSAIGFVFKADSVDQFGDPLIHIGMNWAF